MRSMKLHKAMVADAMNQANATRKNAEIIQATNVCMNTLAGLFPIGALCAKITVTAGDDAWLPPHKAGIIMVRETETGRRVWERGEAASIADEEIYRYYEETVRAASSTTALPFKGTCAISAGGSTITCAALGALEGDYTLAGQFVRIFNETYGEYFYEIDEVNEDGTIEIVGTHPYAETAAEITVRGESASRIRFVDDSETAITSTQFDVYYWTFPNPLTLDTDIIPLVYPDVLELMVIRRLPETKERRPVSKGEIDDAIQLAKKRESKQAEAARPSNQQGSPFVMSVTSGTELYTQRGG